MAQIAKTLGAFEGGWQIGLQEMTERIDNMETKLDRVIELLSEGKDG